MQTRLILLALVLALAVGCSTKAATPALTLTPTPKNEHATLAMVPMPDGVHLATDIYLPRGDGPWPVLLSRTPYSRKGGSDAYAELFNRAGYAVVVQDTRGRFDSEGTDQAFFTATQDGQATLEWIAAQPWSDGQVGTWGASAMGIAAYLMAPNAPEALRCQLALIATPDLYRHAAFPGGVLRKSLVEGWLKAQGSEYLLDDWLAHPFEDVHWDAVDISGRYDEVHIPALHIGGWYDIFTQGTLDAFVGLQERGGDGAAGRQHLIIGPWTHIGMGRQQQGQLTYPENAVLDGPEFNQMTLDWFQACLLGDSTVENEWPVVRYYVMGDVDDTNAPGNEWREAVTWPPPSTEMTLHLHADGSLSETPPGPDEGDSTFVYDPAAPSPTVCGGNLLIRAGPCDQRTVEARDDALIFSTAPLEQPLEVTGRVRARLWLVSDAPDTDLAVRLTDVYPDGRSMLVTDGVLRARFRGLDFTHEELMTPGTPYELEIDVGSTSIVFNAGHRLRIIVTSSNAPRFDPNPNTGLAFRSSDETRVATNKILHDAARPSALLLPVPKTD